MNVSANKTLVLPSPISYNPQHTQHNNQDTSVVYLGARNIYFAKEAPIQNFNVAAPKVHVGPSTVQVQTSIRMGTLGLPHLPAYLPRTGHIMTLLKHALIGIGIICDAKCKVLFTKIMLWSTTPNNNPS